MLWELLYAVHTGFRVTESRGTLVQTAMGPVVATVHPSAILRVREEDDRASAMDAFVRDLRSVARRLAPRSPTPHIVRPRPGTVK